ncbi:MAG: endolytic transglycosylase MltG [Bacteroidia bacterium]|jgi:UPF0755 protein|nr:endolytic transglycosylase MltG [Bacteroidia bacterium]
MKAKKRNTRKPIYIAAAVVLLVLIAFGVKVYEDVFAPNTTLTEGEKEFVFVPTLHPLDDLKRNWELQGVVKHPETLIRLIRLLGFENKLKPGRYEVTPDMSNYQLLRLMASGKQTPINITFKYAERKTDLAGFWSKHLEADSATIVALLNNPYTLPETELDTANSVSVCIPNTYNFYWNTPAEDLLLRLQKEYNLFWNEVRKEQAAKLELTPAQVSVLASIVQKETYQKSEMPTIAGVYYNRLKRNMPLQADPTILFAINDKSIRRVSGSMLKIESPYNSYTRKGLPPGPICVASVQAIDAVLQLQSHSYIYFCAREDFSGYHRFAASFAEHQINARKYQRELNRRGIR